MLRGALLAILIVSLPFPSPAGDMFGPSKEMRFWKWFQKNEERLFSFEQAQEAIFDELSRQMTAVDPNLTFEFSPVLEDGRREFVISAGGIKDSFPAVEALAAEAPSLPRWIWVKFRPRRAFAMALRLDDREISTEQIRYAMFKDGDLVGLLLFIEGYNDAEKTAFQQIAYLFLDHFLGEFDVETRVGFIEVGSNDNEYFSESRPLTDFPERFDAYFSEQRKSYH
ncbi:hypothetical protein [Pelagibius sp.]|uniref:hypothetical protein n=1 Tax=Pelagibius sp. TaxID=1931238 RepID=UPI002619C2C7|nr:hypothetical protein [Pelagibius sp.]